MQLYFEMNERMVIINCIHQIKSESKIYIRYSDSLHFTSRIRICYIRIHKFRMSKQNSIIYTLLTIEFRNYEEIFIKINCACFLHLHHLSFNLLNHTIKDMIAFKTDFNSTHKKSLNKISIHIYNI